MADLSTQIQELKQFASNAQVHVIHYGCESWYTVKDRPVAVSCIAINNLVTHAQVCFSLSDYNDDDLIDREKKLLTDFYKNLQKFPDVAYLHWNMHSADFGFAAIDKRYRYLFNAEPPYSIPERKRFDLNSLISFRYGSKYVNHPKMANLGILNKFNKRVALNGAEEAEKFESKGFGEILRSTTEKADMILFLGNKFLKGTLETNHSGPRVIFANEILDANQIVIEIGSRFKAISRQLKERHSNRETLKVNDEYDFQDLFHVLLRIFFDDIRTEEWTPNYAGAQARTDFLIQAHGIAVELKHARESLSEKQLGEQLIVDIHKYKEHPKVRILVCLVFDPEGHIKNPAGIESDLSGVIFDYPVVTKILT